MGIKLSTELSIVYLCNRLGPYHIAQLNAANKYAKITVIEFSSKDQTYAWNSIEDVGRLSKVTLYNDKPISEHNSSLVAAKLQSVLNEIKPETVAIMGWDYPACLMVLQWCIETNTPSIMLSDSQKHDIPRFWWKEFIKKRIVKLSSAGFVGGVSHISYMKSLGMPEDRIVTGVDVVNNEYFANGAFSVQQNSVNVRRKFSLPENYFLVSSRFIHKKNLPMVMHAYAKYKLTLGDNAWKLVLLGDGQLKSELLKLRDELCLNELILMPGFKQYDELPAYYGLSGAFILASTSEQWGLVVNEAMASGLPVLVSSHCGCAPDLVAHGKNGFVFDPYDIEDLVKHLTFISSNECPRELMGNESRKIIKDWDLERFAINLTKAAELAMSAPPKLFSVWDRALLWALIHRF